MQTSANTLHLALPEKLDIDGIFRFSRDLSAAGNYRYLSLDLGAERWFPPFSMLFLATLLRRWKTENTETRLFLRSHEQHPHAKRAGFFRTLGLDYGPGSTEATSNKRSIPIKVIQRSDMYKGPDDKYVELQDLIQRCADDLSEIICRDTVSNKDLHEVLSYSIREVFRNVFEHSEANELFFCAQMWESTKKVEVSIADLGIGIRRGLGENPNFRFKEDKEAIEYSLLPSVSGKTHLPRVSSNWFNSGYGLYMTNRLARNGGNFVIASGNKGMRLTAATKTNYDVWFPGTALRLNFDIGKIGDVQKRLREFRDDGAKLSKTIKGSANRPPSAMSLLLRRDFH